MAQPRPVPSEPTLTDLAGSITETHKCLEESRGEIREVGSKVDALAETVRKNRHDEANLAHRIQGDLDAEVNRANAYRSDMRLAMDAQNSALQALTVRVGADQKKPSLLASSPWKLVGYFATAMAAASGLVKLIEYAGPGILKALGA